MRRAFRPRTRSRRAILQYLDVRKSVTIAEAKDVLKVSRKYACAVLEHLDRTGATRRAGDTHVLK